MAGRPQADSGQSGSRIDRESRAERKGRPKEVTLYFTADKAGPRWIFCCMCRSVRRSLYRSFSALALPATRASLPNRVSGFRLNGCVMAAPASLITDPRKRLVARLRVVGG